MDRIRYIQKLNRKRCIFGLILSITIAAFIFYGVLLAVLSEHSDLKKLDVFQYYTVLSNLFLLIPTLMCISYQIDGIIKKHYSPPSWLVYLQYSSTVCVTFTFITVVTLLTKVKSLDELLFAESDFELHLIAPCLSIPMFVFVNYEHRVSRRHALFAAIPIAVYFAIYIIEVLLIGEKNGGWKDFYQVTTAYPLHISAALLLIVAIGVSILLRLLHNTCGAYIRKRIRKYLALSERSIEETVSCLAMLDKKDKSRNDGTIYVPAEVLLALKERFGSAIELSELCRIYTDTYLGKDAGGSISE